MSIQSKIDNESSFIYLQAFKEVELPQDLPEKIANSLKKIQTKNIYNEYNEKENYTQIHSDLQSLIENFPLLGGHKFRPFLESLNDIDAKTSSFSTFLERFYAYSDEQSETQRGKIEALQYLIESIEEYNLYLEDSSYVNDLKYINKKINKLDFSDLKKFEEEPIINFYEKMKNDERLERLANNLKNKLVTDRVAFRIYLEDKLLKEAAVIAEEGSSKPAKDLFEQLKKLRENRKPVTLRDAATEALKRYDENPLNKGKEKKRDDYIKGIIKLLPKETGKGEETRQEIIDAITDKAFFERNPEKKSKFPSLPSFAVSIAKKAKKEVLKQIAPSVSKKEPTHKSSHKK